MVFRLVSFDDNATPGVAQFDKFVVLGSVAAIPEPSSFALLAGALTLGVVSLRRRPQNA